MTESTHADERRMAGLALASAIAICELIMLTLVICAATGFGVRGLI